ncbi:uncharacterized protein METZ01_LOCUS268473, partial [marine metagenome]
VQIRPTNDIIRSTQKLLPKFGLSETTRWSPHLCPNPFIKSYILTYFGFYYIIFDQKQL